MLGKHRYIETLNPAQKVSKDFEDLFLLIHGSVSNTAVSFSPQAELSHSVA